MRKDERLKTIYEVVAPHIVRSESNWREYLSFAAGFFKHPFDIVLLVYAQNPNVTMLATVKQWNDVGGFVNKDEKGLAVCAYENAKLSINHLFDITQTHGRELKPTDWQLEDSMKSEMVKRLAFSHGFKSYDFPDLIRSLAEEAATEHYEAYLQDLGTDIDGHLFSVLPKDGLEMQFLELLTDSMTYFIGKRCGLSDEAIILHDGMVTVGHFEGFTLLGN